MNIKKSFTILGISISLLIVAIASSETAWAVQDLDKFLEQVGQIYEQGADCLEKRPDQADQCNRILFDRLAKLQEKCVKELGEECTID